MEICPLGNIFISRYEAIKTKPNGSLKTAGNKDNTERDFHMTAQKEQLSFVQFHFLHVLDTPNKKS